MLMNSEGASSAMAAQQQQQRVTLVVKHLPPELNEHAITELLARYGAIEVRPMRSSKLAGTAFAVFPDIMA